MPSASCPYCPWSDHSYRLPKHLVANHPDRLHVSPIRFDHYITATADAGSASIDMCYCLTCKQGTPNSSFEGQGARWVSLHEKKAECRKAHPAAFAAFKQRYTETRAAAAAEAAAKKEAAKEPPPKEIAASLTALWDKCKSNKLLHAMVCEIEAFQKSHDDDEEDPLPFDVGEAFTQAVRSAASYQKQVALSKEEMEKMVVAHEAELTEHRREIHELRTENKHAKANFCALKESIATLTSESEQMKERIRQLEARLGITPATAAH
jgi:hypothetical protein